MKYQIIIISTIFFVAIFSIHFCFSQEQELEKLLEEETEYSDQSDLIESLMEFEKNPININTATMQQLSILPWITPSVAKNIVDYRSKHGNFKDIVELMNVSDITADLINILKNYISAEEQKTDKIFELKQRSRVNRKIEKSIGYKNGDYFNSPNKYYNQFKATLFKNYNIGLVLEKDSGEKSLNDLTLYYFMYQDLSKRNKVVLGNYRLEIGQGLIFWNPYSYGKGSSPIYSAIKRERGLLNYTVVDENASLFGAAVQICLKIYQLILFYSNNKLDATLNSQGIVENISKTGYHRTSNELAKKDILNEKLIGSRFVLSPWENFCIGGTFYRTLYNKPIENADVVRNRFDFRGKENYVVSTDIKLRHNNIYFFGEAGQSQNKGWAAIFGVNFSVKPINILLLYRNYSKDFQSLHGSAFGEKGGVPQNEQGFYTGIRYKIFSNTNISFYYDIFKYPWRTYLENMPVAGSDLLFQVDQKISRKLKLTFRLKNKKREKNIKINDLYQRLTSVYDTENKLNLRFQIEYVPISNLKLRGRVEKCNLKFTRKGKGLLLYQDMRYQIKNKMNMYFRLTFFDTDSYDTRLYQFENDLPYVLTNQMLYGKGSRWYICILYNIFDIMKLGIKYTATNYENVNSIGSGNDIINDDAVHTISFQIESYF